MQKTNKRNTYTHIHIYIHTSKSIKCKIILCFSKQVSRTCFSVRFNKFACCLFSSMDFFTYGTEHLTSQTFTIPDKLLPIRRQSVTCSVKLLIFGQKIKVCSSRTQGLAPLENREMRMLIKTALFNSRLLKQQYRHF